MKALLRRIFVGRRLSRRDAFGVRRFDDDGAFDMMNDAQLRDIGLWRDDEHRYLRLREPAALEVLFPDTGGTPVGEGSRSRSGPTRPHVGVKEDTPTG